MSEARKMEFRDGKLVFLNGDDGLIRRLDRHEQEIVKQTNRAEDPSAKASGSMTYAEFMEGLIAAKLEHSVHQGFEERATTLYVLYMKDTITRATLDERLVELAREAYGPSKPETPKDGDILKVHYLNSLLTWVCELDGKEGRLFGAGEPVKDGLNDMLRRVWVQEGGEGEPPYLLKDGDLVTYAFLSMVEEKIRAVDRLQRKPAEIKAAKPEDAVERGQKFAWAISVAMAEFREKNGRNPRWIKAHPLGVALLRMTPYLRDGGDGGWLFGTRVHQDASMGVDQVELTHDLDAIGEAK